MSARRAVVVPVEYALVFTADRDWHVLAAPTPEWLAEQEQQLLEDERTRDARLAEAARVAACTGWSTLSAEEREMRAQRAADARWEGRRATA